ncbi:hypothetical protein [Roseibium algae]|uniref:Uncharacterized protein n=1 Tax=Roseibium algae TaxID=3123038 RepID=A0ABU8TFV4_9HYPH
MNEINMVAVNLGKYSMRENWNTDDFSSSCNIADRLLQNDPNHKQTAADETPTDNLAQAFDLRKA